MFFPRRAFAARKLVPVGLTLMSVFGLSLASNSAMAGGNDLSGSQKNDWAGLYTGFHVGYGQADIDSTHINSNWWTFAPNRNFPSETNGFVYGGQLGYNYQSGDFVVGAEVGYSKSSLSKQSPSPYFPTLDAHRADIDDIFSISGRLGYEVFDGALLYVKGGYVSARITVANNDFVSGNTNLSSKSSRHGGWLVGLGFEKKLMSSVSLGIEYNLMELDAKTISLNNSGPSVGGSTINARVDPDRVHAITLRLNIALTK